MSNITQDQALKEFMRLQAIGGKIQELQDKLGTRLERLKARCETSGIEAIDGCTLHDTSTGDFCC